MNAPGCFGLSSCVSATSPSCRECPSRSGCVSHARHALDKLPDCPAVQRARLALSVTGLVLVGSPQGGRGIEPQPQVVASTRGVQRMTLTAAQERALEPLAPRVRSAVHQLMERGWFAYAKSELTAGRNPATKGWQKLLCDLLLGGGGSREQLQLALMTTLDLAPASARMQASVGLAVFAAGQLTRESRGWVTFNPN